jgi:hypothetical protein
MESKKKIIVGAITACLAPVAHADIELGEGLSATGFLDMSYTNFDADGAPGTERSFGIDQFEIDFMWSGTSGVSAQVDIEYGESAADGSGGDETFVEQAFITKSFSDKFSVKAGRFLSYQGYESEEPTGLYQYSIVGYQQYFYGWYQQGVSAYYDGDTVDFMASVVNSAFDPLDRDSDPDIELGVAFSPSDGFTAKLFYIDEDEDDVIDLWAEYAVGNMTFGAEYITRDYGAGGDGDGQLLMANYAPGNFGFTVRYGAYEIQDAFGVSSVDTDSFTLAPSYTVGDNLLLVAEYRMDKDNISGLDSNTFAIEALFTF